MTIDSSRISQDTRYRPLGRSEDALCSDGRTMIASMRLGADRSLALIVFVLLAFAALLPVLLTPIPAMVDYPNHLARMYLLSQNGTPDANPYYETAWALQRELAPVHPVSNYSSAFWRIKFLRQSSNVKLANVTRARVPEF